MEHNQKVAYLLSIYNKLGVNLFVYFNNKLKRNYFILRKRGAYFNPHQIIYGFNSFAKIRIFTKKDYEKIFKQNKE